ncbi:MAG: hypothetical protein ACFFAJ_17610 [Candidatus Hodarchaeota archaeon]
MRIKDNHKFEIDMIFDRIICKRCGKEVTKVRELYRRGATALQRALRRGYCSPSCQGKDRLKLYAALTAITLSSSIAVSLIFTGSPFGFIATLLTEHIIPFGYFGIIPIFFLILGVVLGFITLLTLIQILAE